MLNTKQKGTVISCECVLTKTYVKHFGITGKGIIMAMRGARTWISSWPRKKGMIFQEEKKKKIKGERTITLKGKRNKFQAWSNCLIISCLFYCHYKSLVIFFFFRKRWSYCVMVSCPNRSCLKWRAIFLE